MFCNRLRYEVKLAWKALILSPLLLLAPIALIVALQETLLNQSPAHALLAAVEMMLPMAAGVIVATTLAHDDALELHLTTPSAYARTGILRLALIVGWIGLLACVALGGIAALGLLSLPTFTESIAPPLVQLTVLQLLWLAPLSWLAAVGFCLALLSKSRTAGGALLGGIWLLQALFVGTIAQTTWLRPVLLFPATLVLFPAAAVSPADFTAYWLVTRVELVATALVLFALGWLLLQNTEGLLKGMTNE